VAVVGTGGYKNERQQTTGNHWAKIYASGCKQVIIINRLMPAQ
jgi:hypothetical protein